MRLPLFRLALSLLLAPAIASAQESARWEDLRDGQHSLRKLGPDFSIEMPVRRLKDARVLLFNQAFARALGLPVPSDPAEAERFLIDLLGWEIDPDLPYGADVPAGVPTRIATYYYDSPPPKEDDPFGGSGWSPPEKQPGEARGDGRVIWLGEFVIRRDDGTLLFLDVTSRGVGAVKPLAWTNHPKGTHQNGRQEFDEGPISYVNSAANWENQLDTSVDLVTFVVGDRTITVRAGNMTRFAHFRYHDDDLKRMIRITDYIINRTLGRKPDAPVAGGDARTYLDRVALRLGENSARTRALRMVHGSPTYGNMGTAGGFLDTTTNVYLPQYDLNWRSSMGESLKDAEFHAENYISRFWQSYYQSGAYEHYVRMGSIDAALLVRRTHSRRYAQLLLLRLGIPADRIGAISERNLEYGVPSQLDRILGEEGTRVAVNNGARYRASLLDADAFVAGILQFARWHGVGPDSYPAWKDYFARHVISEGDPAKIAGLQDYVPRFCRELESMFEDLGITAAGIPSPWISQAARARLPIRPSTEALHQRLLFRLQEAMKKPWNWTVTNRIAEEEISVLIDREAPHNPDTQLGEGPRRERLPGTSAPGKSGSAPSACELYFHQQ